jgi:hypothetical protein
VKIGRTGDTLPVLGLIGQVLNPDSPQPRIDSLIARAGAIDWPLVVALASDHLVTPALHPRLGLATLEPELERYFRTVTELNRARNRRIRAQVEHLVGVLNVVGIRPLLLKGTAHLLLGLYDDDADRVIGDIDLLVAPEERDQALGALVDQGYAPHLDGELEHAHLHHYPPLARHDSEAWVELHKTASPHGAALPTRAMILRSSSIRAGSGAAAVPGPEDLLVHNIVHSQLYNHGFWSAEFALRDAYDLVLLARRFRHELDWPQLAARIAADVGRHSAGFYVRRAHLVFSQSPPPLAWPLGARLADRRWRWHARGRMLWLRRSTRIVAHELRFLSEAMHNPSWRRRPVRRLLDPRWYRARLGRVRAASGG